jgi:3-hydroxy acid dehydrogenase/malonic semialdehyde reductase
MKKVVLITGATSGFGEATAHLLANNGFDLILCGRREDRLNNVKSACAKCGAQVWTAVLDVRNENEVEDFVKQCRTWTSEIFALINNAGLAVGREPIHQGISDDWQRMMDTNVKGLLWMSKYVSQWMVEQHSGTIINIGSVAGKQAYAGGVAYNGSKFAVDGITQAMRIDLVAHNIRVGQICPGAAETEFSLVRFKGDKTIASKVYDGFQPLVAQDIAETVLFMITRPPHVNIQDVWIMPTAQASATVLYKNA